MNGRAGAGYRRPALRTHAWGGDLPTLITIHDHRLVASVLGHRLDGELRVVADTVFGAVALQLTELLTPDVIVTSDVLRDGMIDQFLPSLILNGARVLLLVESIEARRALELAGAGVSAICMTSEGVDAVCAGVRTVAAGGAVLPGEVLAPLLREWRLGRRQGRNIEQRTGLTAREAEVLDALAAGLSNKAIARLLGMAPKTVENHKTRIFAKLGVRTHAQAVAMVAHSPAPSH
ncbi:MAG: response regulator transcription factor [Actinomycetota bacterium]|nr:response regulator transcription factor [Actinomycetota bacterium]